MPLTILLLIPICCAEAVIPEVRTNRAPAVRIGSMSVNGQPTVLSGASPSVTIPTGSLLQINFTNPGLTAPGEGHFRYRLDGIQNDWTDAGSAQRALFSKIPPGRYRFVVQSAAPDGNWDPNSSQLNITVKSGRAFQVAVLAVFICVFLFLFMWLRRGAEESALPG